MNRNSLLAVLAVGMTVTAGAYAIESPAATTSSQTFTFVPSDNDIYDFPHAYYYTWGIDWAVPEGESIIDAKLTILNLDDWTNEKNDHLFSHLLDEPRLGLRRWTDNQGGGDNFGGDPLNRPLIGDYTDPGPGTETLTYSFGELGLLDDLTAFSANGRFGFGFDPDCHYYNRGVRFEIETGKKFEPPPPPRVPDTGLTAVLLGLGLTSVAIIRRRLAV